jgi:DNA (cytosine-5)-methyltransferase 1
VRAISLFSGVGGFELGFEPAGIVTTTQVEIDPDCRSILERRWPLAERLEDVRDVDSAALCRGGPVDLLYGGFPCQDFSNSYSRGGGIGGLGGTRSGLWWQFHRLAAETQAAWVVLENVQNILRANAGRDWFAIVSSLDELGYCVAWTLLDARGFGVPQQRRRLFLVGHLGDGRGPIEVLDLANRRQRHAGEGFGGGRAYSALTESEARAAGPLSLAENQQAEFRLLPFSPSLNAAGGKVGQGYQAFMHGDVLRRYTPLEEERLMGWPDHHTASGADGRRFTDTRRYAFIGNGVVAPVARWLGERLVAVDGATRALRSA